MANTIPFELVSPAKLLLSEEVEMVTIPGGEGDFGVLPKHAPMLSTVRPGVINIYNAGKVEKSLFVHGGFAEVSEERVTVLAEEALDLADLSEAVANDRLATANESLKAASNDVERQEAERAVKVAEAMIVATKGS